MMVDKAQATQLEIATNSEKKKRKTSPFRKAKAEQASLKIAKYGPPGSGKTLTALILAEGLAGITGKRIAYIDTERGTDFYTQNVPERTVHPEAFDFDALYTQSITEVLDAVKSLDPDEYGVIVVDSITHLWEAAKNAYTGKTTSIGTIPLHAWGKIKKPYKEMISLLLSSPIHVIICGRQGNEFEDDELTGELKKVGVKMKAEGETPYEPHILIRMEAVKNPKDNSVVITAFAEKDRTGILAGKTIEWPNFDNLAKPLLPLLGDTQAHVPTEDETSAHDAEALSEKEKKRIKESATILKRYRAMFELCNTLEDLKAIGEEITPALKKQMESADVTELRESYLNFEEALSKK